MFRFYRIRFTLAATGRDTVYFPPGKAANVLRGALGSTLRKMCCDPAVCESARTCGRRSTCAYARIFEPVLDSGPSGLHDPPRPFVLRASALDGVTVRPGIPFHFDLHLFLVEAPPLAEFVKALAQLAESGLGPSRGRVILTAVDLLDLNGATQSRILDNGRFTVTELPPPLVLGLSTLERPEPHLPELLHLDFLTPTEIKQGGRVLDRPSFPALLSRIRDRLGSLGSLYGGDSLNLDWKGLGERAEMVKLNSWEQGARARVDRFSTKTLQTHPIGGITGRAVYVGPYAEFLPLLHAAEFTGVGRQTVWGKGHIRVLLSAHR